MNNGYTLFELIITFAILAILSVLAIPGLNFLLNQSQSVTLANQLVSAIHFAQSAAVHKKSVVTICASRDHMTCSGSWSQGWIIFVDHKKMGQVNPGDEILKVYEPVPPGSLLEWRGQRSPNYLQLDPNGTTRGQAGTFYYYPNRANKQQVKKVIISYTGRARIE